MKLPYMPFYPSDFLCDEKVCSLSMAAQGCYMRLLCLMWNCEGAHLPNDTLRLSRMAGIKHREFLKFWSEIQTPDSPIFTVTEDGTKITQKRLLSEWEKVSEKCAKRQAIAVERWEREAQKKAIQKHIQEDIQLDMQEHIQEDIQLQSKIISNCSDNQNQIHKEPKDQSQLLPDEGAEKPKTEPAIPPCEPEPLALVSSSPPKAIDRDGFEFHVTVNEFVTVWNAHMPDFGLSQVRTVTKTRDKAFRARIREDPEERNQLQFWKAALRFTSESPFLMGKGPPQQGREPWKMDIDWLIGAGLDRQGHPRDGTNLTRVLEGYYHQQQTDDTSPHYVRVEEAEAQ